LNIYAVDGALLNSTSTSRPWASARTDQRAAVARPSGLRAF